MSRKVQPKDIEIDDYDDYESEDEEETKNNEIDEEADIEQPEQQVETPKVEKHTAKSISKQCSKPESKPESEPEQRIEQVNSAVEVEKHPAKSEIKPDSKPSKEDQKEISVEEDHIEQPSEKPTEIKKSTKRKPRVAKQKQQKQTKTNKPEEPNIEQLPPPPLEEKTQTSTPPAEKPSVKRITIISGSNAQDISSDSSDDEDQQNEFPFCNLLFTNKPWGDHDIDTKLISMPYCYGNVDMIRSELNDRGITNPDDIAKAVLHQRNLQKVIENHEYIQHEKEREAIKANPILNFIHTNQEMIIKILKYSLIVSLVVVAILAGIITIIDAYQKSRAQRRVIEEAPLPARAEVIA